MGTEIDQLPAAHLLKMVAGDAADVTFTREEAVAELLRRLYSQEAPCTEWGEGVESRLDSLWKIHEEVNLEKLAEQMEELEGQMMGDNYPFTAPLAQVVQSIARARRDTKERIRGILERLDAYDDWIDRADEDRDKLSDRISEARAEGAGPMPVEQVMDQIVHHAKRASELTEKAIEEEDPGRREDWIAAARIHNQTARALSVVVDHRRAVR